MMKRNIFLIAFVFIFLYPYRAYASDYRNISENNNLRLFADSESALINLECRDTSYIWYSGENFSNTLVYSTDSGKSSKITDSENGNCRITVSEISGGICAVYDYYSIGIKYPVEYTLKEDYLSVSLKVSEIQESGSAEVLRINFLDGLGSAQPNENGYFVIPDGCGAVIDFSGRKNSYSGRVYGDNITVVPDKMPDDKKQICFPCYGIVKNGNALLVTASEGDSDMFINACTGDINKCSFSFVIRDTDIFSMSGESSSDISVSEKGDIKCGDIEIRYYPIQKKNADYNDIAVKYREYIMDFYKLSPLKSTENYFPFYMKLYGGTETESSFMGIPSKGIRNLTDFSQANMILENLFENGISDIVFSYDGWTDDGICSKIDTSAKPSGKLGGKEDFKKLLDYIDSGNIEFYPRTDNIKFSGFFLGNTAVRVSGSYSRIPGYSPAYGVRDNSKDFLSVLSPARFREIYSKISRSYEEYSLDGINIGMLSNSLYGDYAKKKLSRYDTLRLVCESCEILDRKILAECPNVYIFPYVNFISDVPLQSSQYDIFSYDIPFYQMVIHGIIPYSSEAVNSMPNPEKYILESTVYGCIPGFEFVYENSAESVYYYADYSGWIDTAVSGYKFSYQLLERVSRCFIEKCYKEGDNITAVYSDGTVIKVNPERKMAYFAGKEFVLE